VCAASHRDLRAWKLADVVRRHIVALCIRPQADRAAASACRNLAEGFARDGHADFARFVTIPCASLAELLDWLDEALAKGDIDAAEHRDIEGPSGWPWSPQTPSAATCTTPQPPVSAPTSTTLQGATTNPKQRAEARPPGVVSARNSRLASNLRAGEAL